MYEWCVIATILKSAMCSVYTTQSCIPNSTVCIPLKDLAQNSTLNELAKASSAEKNMSGPFRMEHFDYSNPVIVEQMMENWNNLAFTGITVSLNWLCAVPFSQSPICHSFLRVFCYSFCSGIMFTNTACFCHSFLHVFCYSFSSGILFTNTTCFCTNKFNSTST